MEKKFLLLQNFYLLTMSNGVCFVCLSCADFPAHPSAFHRGSQLCPPARGLLLHGVFHQVRSSSQQLSLWTVCGI